MTQQMHLLLRGRPLIRFGMRKYFVYSTKDRARKAQNESVLAFYILSVLLLFFGIGFLVFNLPVLAFSAIVESLVFGSFAYISFRFSSRVAAAILVCITIIACGSVILQSVNIINSTVIFSVIVFGLALRLFVSTIDLYRHDIIQS